MRVYLKTGDIVTVSMVDLIVTKKENTGRFCYAVNHIDGDAEMKQ